MKLALGTVQFGLNYGISNDGGKTPFEEVVKIIDYAESAGIKVLDTAASYGESEKVIGQVTKSNDFSIVTKVPAFKSHVISDKDIQQIESTFHDSLKKLKRDKIDGIILHDVNDLFKKNGEKIYLKLLKLKEMNLVDKIGFSIYESEQIDKICELYTFDIIQLPINVLDQRLLKNNQLSKLKSLGVEIYARSIFLQGLLLMDLESIPSYFDPIRPTLSKYHKLLQENDMTLLDGAINFIKNIKEIDYLVVGVNNLDQLIEINKSSKVESGNEIDYTIFTSDNKEFIDPRRW